MCARLKSGNPGKESRLPRNVCTSATYSAWRDLATGRLVDTGPTRYESDAPPRQIMNEIGRGTLEEISMWCGPSSAVGRKRRSGGPWGLGA